MGTCPGTSDPKVNMEAWVLYSQGRYDWFCLMNMLARICKGCCNTYTVGSVEVLARRCSILSMTIVWTGWIIQAGQQVNERKALLPSWHSRIYISGRQEKMVKATCQWAARRWDSTVIQTITLCLRTCPHLCCNASRRLISEFNFVRDTKILLGEAC